MQNTQSLSASASDRATATVPDTLDLAERAALAINGLGGSSDPEHDYHHYFYIRYNARPPYMYHWGANDSCCTPKFAESFPMMRMMCGSTQHADLEREQLQALLKTISPEDWLYYCLADPAKRPWHMCGDHHYDSTHHQDFAPVFSQGRMARTLMALWERDGRDPAWADMARKMLRGIRKLLVYKDDYAYHPDAGVASDFCCPRSGWRHTREPGGDAEGGEGSVTAYHGQQLYAIGRWLAVTGDEELLNMGQRLVKFIMRPQFWGGYVEPLQSSGQQLGHCNYHLHARAIPLRALLSFGMATGDRRLIDFVRSSYEYQRMFGIPQIGWIPCYGPSTKVEFNEACFLGDLVGVYIRLSDAGAGDYWDDVDHIVRNHLVEQQLTSAKLLERVAAGGIERSPGSKWFSGPDDLYIPHQNPPGMECSDKVIERTLGVWGAWATPTSIPTTWVMQCCTANASQGLYYAWEGAVREQLGGSGRAVQVNLLLNHTSAWIEMDSSLPYEGKVAIRNKTAQRLAVRIPGWVNLDRVRFQLNARDVAPALFAGRYAVFTDLKPGDQLTLTFDVPDRTIEWTAQERAWKSQKVYKMRFRGSTLVDISPRDEGNATYPLYQRDHLKAGGPAPLKTTQRYVAPKTVTNW